MEIGRESSEQLEIISTQVKVIRQVWITYGCPHCCAGVKLAPLPPQPRCPRPWPRQRRWPWVAVSKYVYGLPLYRLEFQFARMG
ncbi:MAG: IS66 family transposase, partial [Magnetococcales bacterium]|nr:IS66 family transposase [Magnetococcales bacterium]